MPTSLNLPPHMLRVVTELNELSEKTIALKTYIDNGCPKASTKEMILLVNQHGHMVKYAEVLKYRLELYQPKVLDVEVIFAVTRNKVFGQGGGIPWRIREDLIHFKETTMGHPVIMGRKTFESLPVDLPGRKIIVVTSKEFEDVEKLNTKAHLYATRQTLDGAIVAATFGENNKVFVIGGKELIREALPLAKVAHVSLINLYPLIDAKTVVLDFVSISRQTTFGTDETQLESNNNFIDRIYIDSVENKDIELKLGIFSSVNGNWEKQ